MTLSGTQIFLVAVTAAAVGALLVGIGRGIRPLEVWAKALASASFVALGAASWSAGHPVATCFLAGLVLAAAGDLLLLGDRTFDAGLAAFLLGHLAYVAAFWWALPPWRWPAVPAVIIAAAAVAVARWLWPALGRRRLPVAAYIVVISFMVWGALAVAARGLLPSMVAAGATLFYLSDLAVARHRFLQPAFINRALGLPTYYAGQVLIALTIAAA